MRLLVALLLAGTATPAIAQDHSGHAMPPKPPASAPTAQSECEMEAARHRAMGHPVAAGACAPAGGHAKEADGSMPAMDHSGHAMPPSPPAGAPTVQPECEREAARHRAMGHPVAAGACAPAGDHAKEAHGSMPAMDHPGHAMPPSPPASAPTVQSECEMEAARHRAMGHPVAAGACAPAGGHAKDDHGSMPATDHSKMDHSRMDHSRMDHSQMDHSAMQHGAADAAAIPAGPPPPSAGSGPPRAADAIWGADAMRASRKALRTENGGMQYFWVQGDRAEYRARSGGDGYLWDLQGYYGGDIDKFWFKSEGEGTFGEKPESAELQGLWSHAIGPWWDLQLGVRQDLTGPGRTHAVIGAQGLAPYLFEVDAAAFLSSKGDLTARVEVELDERITQRLILQPRAELNLSAQDVPELGIGSGLDSIELGLRLRYEIAREFAPYIGVEQEWKLGRSADFARLAGEDPSVTNYVVGVRFWF